MDLVISFSFARGTDSRSTQKDLSSKNHLKGFGDLSVEEIVLSTGLSQEPAAMARLLEFAEPIFIEEESKIDEWAAIAASQSFQITAGSRGLNEAILTVFNSLAEWKPST